MLEWLEHLLESEQLPGKIVKLLWYFYRTHLSWPWMFAYGGLLTVAWPHLSLGWKDAFILAGLVFFVLTMVSHVQRRRELVEIREAFYQFADFFRHDGLWGKCGANTQEAHKRLQTAIERFWKWLGGSPGQAGADPHP
jgi:hypothetical protein